MTKRARVLSVVAGAVAIGAVLWLARGTEPVKLTPAQRQTVVVSTVSSGRMQGRARVNVSAQTSGLVVEVPVEEGQRVQPGTLLVRLDDRVAQAALAQAKAALVRAQVKLAEVGEATYPRAQADLRAAEAEAQRAQSHLERTERLAENGAIAAAELESARTAAALAQATAASARVTLNASAPGGIDRRLLAAAVDEARAMVASAQARLDETRIESRVDALVLLRGVEPGEAVTAGRTLMTLSRGDANRLEIVMTPDERSLATLAVGQRARVLADAFPGVPFDAVVKQIAPLVDAGRGTVEVRLEVDDPPAFLREDMTVSVEVITGERPNVLVVPFEAVRDAATRTPWVLVAADGRAQRREVKLGARGGELIEVLEGLSDGQHVVREASVKTGARLGSP